MYRTQTLVYALSAALAFPALAATPVELIRQKLDNPDAGVFVVAHRACHNAVPSAGLDEAPENSRLALEHCVRLGVDMAEVDVRRTKDGQLVILHDATLDRTTNGSGKLADKTLSEVLSLRLRQNFGGEISPTLTDERVLTLAEVLAAARGRIMLNLDIKEDIYPQVIAEVEAAGMSDQVLVKKLAKTLGTPLVEDPLYAKTPFMPIVGHWRSDPGGDAIEAVARQQLSGPKKPVGIELVFTTQAEFEAIAAETKAHKVRLWANTLTSVGVISVIGHGGDLDALRDGGRTWKAMITKGVNTIQTDEPGPLIEMLGGQ
ncbi:glycerophosphodiester phosphodiesterase family protein [Asticcacaulis sp. DW145]|uniref:Glycerophosphodiester phosphodiesterase family protein n=1 Tax=Asticcacaulis currens TaxID=2984210 RepID=A0ABT5IE05_9CAUL|nr:glycerophosphodiester phosphodiesterase family protein [Asticcacaulis currens]MDC7693686.1 glycerophosphodiester phosphodiesterase family protein [Asticcacaulis currens]BEV10344.1 glycerophosphodiester phosphodiesterase family protein [Asticcacaulis sp. DW145]